MRFNVDLLAEHGTGAIHITGVIESDDEDVTDESVQVSRFLDGVDTKSLEAHVLTNYSVSPVQGVLEALKEVVRGRSD